MDVLINFSEMIWNKNQLEKNVQLFLHTYCVLRPVSNIVHDFAGGKDFTPYDVSALLNCPASIYIRKGSENKW